MGNYVDQKMEKIISFKRLISSGIAFFAMLFGSGSIILALALGKDSGNMVYWSLVGFIAATVILPVVGLISILLYEGDIDSYFAKLGKIPGNIIIFICMILLGPLGVIPRLMGTAYSSIKWHFPSISIFEFSIIVIPLLLLFTFKKNNIIDYIGKFLGPIKITIILAFIIYGLIFGLNSKIQTNLSPMGAIQKGLIDGYSTLDLIGVLLIAQFIATHLRAQTNFSLVENDKNFQKDSIKIATIGGFLLFLVYTSLCLLASYHSTQLINVDRYDIINSLAYLILGNNSAIIISAIIIISSLVTAIALTAVFTNYLQKNIAKLFNFNENKAYISCLLATILLTSILTNLGFSGIMNIIIPMAEICYPAIIILTVCNILHKKIQFKYIKISVFTTFIITIIYKISFA